MGVLAGLITARGSELVPRASVTAAAPPTILGSEALPSRTGIFFFFFSGGHVLLDKHKDTSLNGGRGCLYPLPSASTLETDDIPTIDMQCALG